MIAKLRLLFWLGIFVLFIPYIGVTEGIRIAVTICVGIVIIYLTLKLKKQYKQLKYQMRKIDEPVTVVETKSDFLTQ